MIKKPSFLATRAGKWTAAFAVAALFIFAWWAINAYLDYQERQNILTIKRDMQTLQQQIKQVTGKDWTLFASCSAEHDKYSIIGYGCTVNMGIREPVNSVDELKAAVDKYMTVIKASPDFVYTPRAGSAVYPNIEKGYGLDVDSNSVDDKDYSNGYGGGPSPHKYSKSCHASFSIEHAETNPVQPILKSVFYCGMDARTEHSL